MPPEQITRNLQKGNEMIYNQNDMVNNDNNYDIKRDPILYWANEFGLNISPCIDNFKNENIVTFILDNPDSEYFCKTKRQYFYENDEIQIRLKCNDETCTKYYNVEEQNLLIYELKSLCLKQKEGASQKRLKEGKLPVVVENELFSKTKFKNENYILRNKINAANMAINLADEKIINHSHSIEEKINQLINELNCLTAQKDNDFSYEKEYEHCSSIHLTNNTENSKNEKTEIPLKDLITKSNLTDLVKNVQIFTNESELNNFLQQIESLDKLSQFSSSEMNEINCYFDKLIINVRCTIFKCRIEIIERQLNKSKYIEEEIKKKKIEIRDTSKLFGAEYQISDDEEEKYKRLLKSQKIVTKRAYTKGWQETKENLQDDEMVSEIRHFGYDTRQEERDISEIQELIKDAYMKINKYDAEITDAEENLKELEKRKIPCLQESFSLLENIHEAIQKKYGTMVNINELRKELRLHEDEFTRKRNILMNELYGDIYEQLGGSRRFDSDISHKDCSSGCAYKVAVDLGCQFVMEEKLNGRSPSQDDLLRYLKTCGKQNNFPHSTVNHKDDLKRIVDKINERYQEISQKENILKLEIEKHRKDFETKVGVTYREIVEKDEFSIKNDIVFKEKNVAKTMRKVCETYKLLNDILIQITNLKEKIKSEQEKIKDAEETIMEVKKQAVNDSKDQVENNKEKFPDCSMCNYKPLTINLIKNAANSITIDISKDGEILPSTFSSLGGLEDKAETTAKNDGNLKDIWVVHKDKILDGVRHFKSTIETLIKNKTDIFKKQKNIIIAAEGEIKRFEDEKKIERQKRDDIREQIKIIEKRLEIGMVEVEESGVDLKIAEWISECLEKETDSLIDIKERNESRVDDKYNLDNCIDRKEDLISKIENHEEEKIHVLGNINDSDGYQIDLLQFVLRSNLIDKYNYITNIGLKEAQESELKRLKEILQEANYKKEMIIMEQQENGETVNEIDIRLNQIVNEMEKINIENTNLINKRSDLERKSELGLHATIKYYKERVVQEENMKKKELKARKQVKKELVLLKVMEKLFDGQNDKVGVLKDDIDDIEKAKEFYKKRPNKTCETISDNDSEKKEDDQIKSAKRCSYFDALLFVINKKFEEEFKDKSNHDLLELLKSNDSDKFDHIMSNHNNEMIQSFEFLEKTIQDFDEETARRENYYNDKIEKFKFQTKELQSILKAQKLLDDNIYFLKFGERLDSIEKRNEKREDGVDFIVEDTSATANSSDKFRIYFQVDNMEHIFTTTQLISKLLTGNHFNQELYDNLVLAANEMFESVFSDQIPKCIHMESEIEGAKKELSIIIGKALNKQFFLNLINLDEMMRTKIKLLQNKKENETKICRHVPELEILNEKEKTINKQIQLCESEILRINVEDGIIDGTKMKNNCRSFKAMIEAYTGLLSEWENERNEWKMENGIKSKQEEKLEEIKKNIDMLMIDNSSKTEIIGSVKDSVFRDKFRLELRDFSNEIEIAERGDSGHYRHWKCSSNIDCDYYNILSTLFSILSEDIMHDTINKAQLQKGKINKFAKDTLVSKLRRHQNTEPIHIHQKSVYSVIDIIFAQFRIEISNKLKEYLRMQENIKHEILFKDKRIEIISDKYTEQIKGKIDHIKHYLSFKKESCSRKENVLDDINLQNELDNYKNAIFNDSFKLQVEYITKIFNNVQCSIDNEKMDMKHKTEIFNSYYNIFKDYYDNLPNDCFVFHTIIINMKIDLNDDKYSRLKDLIRKKKAFKGGLESILSQISYEYQNSESYDRSFDPLIIYNTLLEEDRSKKMALERNKIDALKEELANLEEQRRHVKVKDNSLMIYELDCLKLCIEFIENQKEIACLKERMLPYGSTIKKDDHYVFDYNNKKICIRFKYQTPEEKSAEIKEIDGIRNRIDELNKRILDKKVDVEDYTKVLENSQDGNALTYKIQNIRKLLFKNGILVAGYDKFENGEELDELDSLIAVSISSLLNEDRVYQIDSLNETDLNIERKTKKIKLLCEQSHVFVDLENRKFRFGEGENFKKGLEFIINKINQEFESDNLLIKKIKVMTDVGHKVVIDTGYETGLNIILLKYNHVFFALIPKSEYTLYKYHYQTDIKLKIANLQSILRYEDCLFGDLCLKRFENVFMVNIMDSKNLSELYKKERMNINKIKSMKSFISSFCAILHLEDELFCYLNHFVKLEQSLVNDTNEEKTTRLNVIKELYRKVLYKTIAGEQKRRKLENNANMNETKEEMFLKELLGEMDDAQKMLIDEIKAKEDEIQRDIEIKNSLLLEKEEAREKFVEQIESLNEMKNNLKEKVRIVQERIKQINNDELKNMQTIQRQKEIIKEMEANINSINNQISELEKKETALKDEITELRSQSTILETTLAHSEKKQKRIELEKTKKESAIKAGEVLIQLIKNIKNVLSDSKLCHESSSIKKAVYEEVTLVDLFTKFRKQKLIWEKMKENITDDDFCNLEACAQQGKLIGGERESDIIRRIKAVVNDAIQSTCEILSEIGKDENGNDITINRFRILGTNCSYSEVHKKVREKVEEEMQVNGNGLRFKDDKLYCDQNGIQCFDALQPKLKKLIHERIEIKFKKECYGEDQRKSAKFNEASKIINELQIDYKDVVKSFIDEIEIVMGGTFFLDKTVSYPGVDLTIQSNDMECVGDDLEIDVSGKNGLEFENKKASNGINFRKIMA